MKFSCVDSNEEEVGIVEAPNAEEALKRAQKLNPNIREVREMAPVQREAHEQK